MAHQLLEQKKGIIFGALNEESIAWKVAERVHEEGGEFILSNAPVAKRMGKTETLGEKTGAEVVYADATSLDDLRKLFETAQDRFGGVDFILHSIGMSPNVRKGFEYTATDHSNFQKTLDISALSFHKLLQVAMEMDLIREWGSVLALSYIAAHRVFPDYNDMADAKALLESIARNFGYQYGKKKKVRINTISQSPTPTTAGTGIKGFQSFLNYSDAMSPLGNASSEDCANYCVTLFSDLTRYVTMQNLFHDGGFSSTGVSQEVMEHFSDKGE